MVTAKKLKLLSDNWVETKLIDAARNGLTNRAFLLKELSEKQIAELRDNGFNIETRDGGFFYEDLIIVSWG